MIERVVAAQAIEKATSKIAELFESFKKDILFNPDLTVADIESLEDQWLADDFFTSGSEARNDKNQAYVFALFAEIRDRFTEISRYAHLSDQELFELIFAEPAPPGVKILRTPISLHVKVPDAETYTKMISKSLEDQVGPQGRTNFKLSEEKKRTIALTQGMTIDVLPASGSATFAKGQVVVSLENSAVARSSEEVLQHEFFHVLFNLLTHLKGRNDSFWYNYQGSLFADALRHKNESQVLVLSAKKYLFGQRLLAEHRAQNEILAHYVSGSSWEKNELSILGSAKRKPYYDYVHDFLSSEEFYRLGSQFNRAVSDTTLDRLALETFSYEAYQRDVKAFLKSLKTFTQEMEAKQLSRIEIATMAALLPVRMWNRL